MDRDDASAWAASILGGLGAVLLFSGAIMSAGGDSCGRRVTLVGLVMLLAFVALLLALVIPFRRGAPVELGR
ncbi:MAG: hypothetical protein ACP5HK_01190 [Acidilobus sp.]